MDNGTVKLFLARQSRHVGLRCQAASDHQLGSAKHVQYTGVHALCGDSPFAIIRYDRFDLHAEFNPIASRLSIVTMDRCIVFEILCCIFGFEEIVVKVLLWRSGHRCVRELYAANCPPSPEMIVASPCDDRASESGNHSSLRYF